METAVNALYDPLGVPFYPVVFQILMVLTFALHILFVNMTLGSTALSIFGRLKGGNRWSRLSKSLSGVISVSISFAILLGVAPLLFVQVLYEPFWYSSNVLSAWWAIGFIFALIAGYSLIYVYYLKGKNTESKSFAGWAVVSLVLFLLAGMIMHILNYQMLLPERWKDWFAPGGEVDPSGTALHAFSFPRFLHFIVPSFAVIGIFLMLYAWYFRERKDFDTAYLEWTGDIGWKLAFYTTMIQAIIGFWWLFTLPDGFSYYMDPAFIVSLIVALGFIVYLYKSRTSPVKSAPYVAGGAFLTVLTMAYSREVLRSVYLKGIAIPLMERKLNLDWGSTLLFFITFILGLAVIAFLYTVVFKAGRTSGIFSPGETLQKWANATIWILAGWIAVMVTLGVILTFTYTF